MHIGLLTVHPLTVPFSSEMLHALVCALHQSVMIYSGYVEPELKQLKEIIELL